MANELKNYESSDLMTLKENMYDILDMEDDDKDETNITANQGMGVQLTNAMKKDGVNIIQMQNVVNKKVTTNVVKSLRLIDKLMMGNIQTTSVTEAKKPNRITMEHVLQVIEWLANKNLSLKNLDQLIRGMYVQEMVSKLGTTIKAAEVLDVSQSQVSKLKREANEAIDILNEKNLEVIE